MFSSWAEREDQVFYPGKRNKWSFFRTKMWYSMRINGFWSKNNLCYDAHYNHELRWRGNPIPIKYKHFYIPDDWKTQLLSLEIVEVRRDSLDKLESDYRKNKTENLDLVVESARFLLENNKLK